MFTWASAAFIASIRFSKDGNSQRQANNLADAQPHRAEQTGGLQRIVRGRRTERLRLTLRLRPGSVVGKPVVPRVHHFDFNLVVAWLEKDGPLSFQLNRCLARNILGELPRAGFQFCRDLFAVDAHFGGVANRGQFHFRSHAFGQDEF